MKFVDAVESGRQVFLHVDAANAYGTPVRSLMTCSFGGKPDEPTLTAFSVDGREYEGPELAAIQYSLITKDAQRLKANMAN